MKLYILNTIFQISDNDVVYFNEIGEVSSRLVNKFKKYDRILPDNPNNFKQVNVNGVRFWYNKNSLFTPNISSIDLKVKKEAEPEIKRTKGELTNRLFNDIKSNNYTFLDTNERKGSCMFISLTKDFIVGYRVFIQSFLKHNPWFDHDIVIMPFDLTDKDIEYVRSFYDKIKFVKPLYDNYRNINKKGLRYEKFVYNYYKLDIFTYTKYEKIVSVDCDMLVQGDISELFIKKYGLGAVPIFTKNDRRRGEFNGGLIVIDSGFNNEINYNKVLRQIIYPYEHAEQDILNNVFRKSYMVIPKTYNAEKRMQKSNDKYEIDLVNSAKIIHYVGGKPWEENKASGDIGYENLEKKWKDSSKNKVLVIGNSPEVLDRKMKNIINSFDVVIRVNDFQINGYEEYVGTKTNHVVCTFATTFNDEYKNINNKDIYMFVAEKYGDYEFLRNRVKEVDVDKVNILENYYLQDLNNNVGIEMPKRCSTGLIAVEFAIRRFKNSDIYIYGIETEYKQKFDKTHYFQKDISTDTWKGSIDKYHDFKKEKEYLQDLIIKNKISKL